MKVSRHFRERGVGGFLTSAPRSQTYYFPHRLSLITCFTIHKLTELVVIKTVIELDSHSYQDEMFSDRKNPKHFSTGRLCLCFVRVPGGRVAFAGLGERRVPPDSEKSFRCSGGTPEGSHDLRQHH